MNINPYCEVCQTRHAVQCPVVKRGTRTLKLAITVTLEVVEGKSDEDVKSAICAQFVGEGLGLMSQPGSRLTNHIVAPKHDLVMHIVRDEYGSTF
jgi:hypothetical protein